MIERTKILDVELGVPPEPLGEMNGYQWLQALVRIHGTPLGYVKLPLFGAAYTTADLRRIGFRRFEQKVIQHHLRDMVEEPLPPGGPGSEKLLDVRHPALEGTLPLITVAVCTHDRPEDLRLCLEALVRLDYPDLDLLVIDNAPSSDAASSLVKGSYPQVRYTCEPRPGLSWARNRAISEARGEILAYTDDDVIVDPGWARALAAAFEEPQVEAVTGMVVPYELETEAQVFFERYGGFGGVFERRYWRMDREGGERPLGYLEAGQYGTGANMAYRRGIFERVGAFDPALGAGTVTGGGEDLEMFFRIVREGHVLAYEPAAVVRHRHRRDYAQLRAQVAGTGTGFFSYLLRTALAYPDTRGDAVRFFLLGWLWRRALVPLTITSARPWRLPPGLILAEIRGCLASPRLYLKARRRAAHIALSYTAEPVPLPVPTPAPKPAVRKEPTIGTRAVDLCRPLRSLDDVADHAEVCVSVALGGQSIGIVDIANRHRPVSAARLRELLVDQLGTALLGQASAPGTDVLQERAGAALRRRYVPGADGDTVTKLPEEVSVSIVVATYDRPDDLRGCLRSLAAQETARPVEVVVVDNNPASGLTPPVVAEFPGAVLVAETRQGASYARNRGFTASRGEIVVTTDDDVQAPVDWLEKLIAPFVRPEVMVATGNTLPLKSETAAQHLFERGIGLGGGTSPVEADSEWFGAFRSQGRAAPTWKLGTTANAAFRANVFAHPEIGLMDEALGAGTPTVWGEDAYLFYKVLRAGYTVAYEPSAQVWHKHRRGMRSLHRRLYDHGKGQVAYYLTALLRDLDPRAAKALTLELPKACLERLASYTKGRLIGEQIDYPLRSILAELCGNLAGPLCLWRSCRRIKREGLSEPYVLASQSATPEMGREPVESGARETG